MILNEYGFTVVLNHYQWLSRYIKNYQDISRWSIIRISINMTISLSHFGHGFSMFFSYLAKFSQPPFPPIPPVFLASFTEGERLKKFAAAYRMFSDMDEPVSRQDVSDVWEGKPGESRVASGSSNGHVSRQGQ